MTSLEVMDMTNSGYNWSKPGSDPLQKQQLDIFATPIDERKFLHRLRVLKIPLETFIIAIMDLTWISRLKKFHFNIGDIDSRLKSLGLVICTFEEGSRAVLDLLPNLEELSLNWMRYLDSISDLESCLGLTCSKLRVIRASNRPRLKNLLSVVEFYSGFQEFRKVPECHL
ncbi:Uncharacterized protein Adt_34798 [Abeliophyllum distichum]|uniref:Uncharacterized protein n=1 Tax=Abeliophyllum distichum TaxID=126358 RepID=A0ABD1R054_9LAMI